MSGPSDITDLFGGPPPGPGQNVNYRQGVVLTFDQATLSNTVNVGGTVLTDLPLLGVGESTLLVPGSVVGIINVSATGGAASWAILGRLVTPGSAQAIDAVGLLNSQIQTAYVADQVSLSYDVWTDLPASFGPQVTVNVRASGRLLVMCTCQIGWVDSNSFTGSGGFVTVEMAGANTVTPGTASNTLLPYSFTSAGTAPGSFDMSIASVTAQGVFAGLTPGLTQVTCKYQATVAGKPVDYSRRTLTVFAL